MQEVRIVGISDPQDNNVVIATIGVQQDEPVNGTGDGDSAPDAALLEGTQNDKVLVRAERAGNGNGRVYHIDFTAFDGLESCAGSVQVAVPPTRNGDAVDDGPTVISIQ